jgi:AraC-like DNA-binding protein
MCTVTNHTHNTPTPVEHDDPSNWKQRVGPFASIPQLLERYSVDPSSVLRTVGLPPDALSDIDSSIPFVAAVQLLKESVRQTHCEHLALSLGKACHLLDLGILGQLVQYCSTVGEALRTLAVYQQLNAQGSAPFLVEAKNTFALGYTVYHPEVEEAHLFQEAALAIAANCIRELAGYDTTFVELTLPRLAPSDEAPYRQHFRCRLRFNASQAVLRFPAALMAISIPGGDPQAKYRLQEKANRLLASSFEIKLYRSLTTLLMMGMHGAGGDVVAQQLAMHRRTLNRRLEVLGTTFQSVLDDVRFSVARQLLRETELPVADIARTLGYTESSAFARAFRRWSGQAPIAWRDDKHRQ